MYYSTYMKYEVRMSGKFNKIIRQMPSNARETLYRLINDIKASGPVQPGYHNYSKLGENTYHCHIAHIDGVACWRSEKGKLIVEVEYVGSREKAPY